MPDPLETRDPGERTASQFGALRALLVRAKDTAPGWARILENVDPADVTDREALARLPVLRKSELGALQASDPPFGGLVTVPVGGPDGIGNVFLSPGPIYEPGIAGSDWWRFGRALRAAGFRSGDLVLNCFAYHRTPAGAMLESGARAVGAAVIPGGTGNSAAQAVASRALRPVGYTGTPDFLKAILDRATEDGEPLDCFRRALVTGGALFPSLREAYANAGIQCFQCYGTADLGLIAYESEALEGLILDEHVIVEIVRPGTGDPVPEGEVGEVLVTVLNDEYPLFRFATGDLSMMLVGPSPCGRTAPRIAGWMGRADQTTKIRGMFVYPAQVAALARRHPEISRVRLEVSRDGEQDALRVLCAVESAPDGLAERIAEDVREILKLRGPVELVAKDALPNDGLVIADLREYDRAPAGNTESQG